MNRLALAAAITAGCEKDPGPPPLPPYLFDSRVPLEGEFERLKQAGDDPTKALHPLSSTDLAKQLEPGKRYAYVVLPNGSLVVAPKPEVAAWSHPVLASGQAVRAAGYLRLEKSGDTISKLTLDGDSDTYCPTNDSLRSALATLVAMKVPSDALRIDNRPPDCFRDKTKAAASAVVAAVPHPSFGTVMLSVARRFEVLGRAHKAKRNELALYQLEEIEETFRNEVPATPLPPLPAGVSITPFLESMTSFNIPSLRKALEAKDPKEIASAYESMAKTCNGCHQAAGRQFVEVPSKPGELVPRLDPKP